MMCAKTGTCSRPSLEDVGCETKTADDGFGALEMTRREMPDVIFMDIRMPKMDGLETAQRILAESGRERVKSRSLLSRLLP